VCGGSGRQERAQREHSERAQGAIATRRQRDEERERGQRAGGWRPRKRAIARAADTCRDRHRRHCQHAPAQRVALLCTRAGRDPGMRSAHLGENVNAIGLLGKLLLQPRPRSLAAPGSGTEPASLGARSANARSRRRDPHLKLTRRLEVITDGLVGIEIALPRKLLLLGAQAQLQEIRRHAANLCCGDTRSTQSQGTCARATAQRTRTDIAHAERVRSGHAPAPAPPDRRTVRRPPWHPLAAI